MRTVLSIEPVIHGGGSPTALHVIVERAPYAANYGQRIAQLAFDRSTLPAWHVQDSVRRRGEMLRGLLEQHAGVARILANLWTTPAGDVKPLFIKLSQGDVESITWEALCDTNASFAALDSRWPIGRIVDPISEPPRPPAALALPLRIFVVISAFGVRGQEREWHYLRDACRSAMAAGMDLRLQVAVGDGTLRAKIDAEVAGGLHWVATTPIESTGVRQLSVIHAFQPHILHFFCHGESSSASGQSLLLATGADYADNTATQGSVRIDASSLADASRKLREPLLIVLNCCSSAAPAAEMMSMAHQAVAAGFRAGVAMLEPVDADDAHEFTLSFYPPLLEGLQEAALALRRSPSHSFEWAPIMHQARRAINARHGNVPAANREWVLPLLYVRGMDTTPFVQAAPVDPAKSDEFRIKTTILATWLRDAARSRPEAERLQVMADVLSDIPPELWPSVDGSFPGA